MEAITSARTQIDTPNGAAFRDPGLPLDVRVRDLIAHMTRAEKIDQITNAGLAIPRLGIPADDAWTAGLHGAVRNGRATVFPQTIGMAATWDAELIRQIASAIGDETRATYHAALRANGRMQFSQGLNLPASSAAIWRGPRCGRGQETWGEDPLLSGALGSAFVRGLQGDHPRYLKAAPRCGCGVAGGATTAMDLEQALARGLIAEADIDRALARSLFMRFELGLFDPPEQVPYASTPLSVVGCAAHWELAYQAAAKSVVLLKNRANLLPLDPLLRSIRVLGPTAADVGVLLGSSHGLSGQLTTLLEGIVDRLPAGVGLEYRPGCQFVAPSASRQDWLFDPDTQPDVVIACMGLTPLLEGEHGDALDSSAVGNRVALELPIVQADFVRRLAATGVKIVLVLTGGGPIALGDLVDLVDAIVFAWYPGQAGGAAVADVLFGEVVPSGKLPVSFPRATADLLPFEERSMAGRDATCEPLFPFGFGLSYTSFIYGDLRLESASIPRGAGLALSVKLANTGADIGEEVVQVYVSALDAPGAPICSLVAFRRVELTLGEQLTLCFAIGASQLELVGDAGARRAAPGRYRVTVGGCSPGARGMALGAPAPVCAEFVIE